MKAVLRAATLIFLALPAALGGAVLSVPRDFATIKSAVKAAAPWDTVEVDDGFYFEDMITLDKPLLLRARNPFRSAISGTGHGLKAQAILIIRSSVVIEGLILMNGVNGILQRGSPDVDWKARNLFIAGMERSAISINDPANNIGRGRAENLIIDGCRTGVEVNDAFGFEVRGGVISRCRTAFWSYNHVYFRLRDVAVWDCPTPFEESGSPVRPPMTNAIARGPGVVVLDELPGERNAILEGFLAPRVPFGAGPSSGPEASAENVRRGILLVTAGSILLEKGECSRARRFFERASGIGRDETWSELKWRADFGLAACLEKEGRLPEALDLYRRSFDLSEGLRARVEIPTSSPGSSLSRRRVALALIRLLREMDRNDPSGDYLCQALSVMERSKARNFIGGLEEAELGLLSRAAPDLREEEVRLSRNISQLQVRLHNPYLPSANRSDLEVQLHEAENAYTDLLVRLRRKVIGAAPSPPPQPLALPKIRDSILDRETALAEYLLGPEFSVALLATRGSLSVELLPGEEEIRRLTGNYLRYLTSAVGGDFKASRGGRRLNDILLGPFEGELGRGVRKIILVPDRDLIDLPFEALVDMDGRFLAEKYEFSYVHSATALSLLQQRTRRRSGENLLAVGVSQPPRPGNPVFVPASRLFKLGHVASEVRAAERAWAGGKAVVLIDDRAEEGVLKKLNLKDYRIIHFAVHGFFDPDRWTRSSLLLWQNGPAEEDGYLQVRDIYPLQLASDLVVLSACQTAKAGIGTGEGMIGLSNVFLYAGSRSVLVSQWNINDRSTAVFMQHFYEALVDGRDIGAAVREAKIRMIKSRYRHPFYWAAFNLIGCSSGGYSITNSREAEAISRPALSRASTLQR